MSRRAPNHKDHNEIGIVFLFLSLVLMAAALMWPHANQNSLTKVGSAEQNSLAPESATRPLPPAVVHRINEDMKDTTVQEEMQKQNTELDVESAPDLGAIDDDAVRVDAVKGSTNPLILDQENKAAKAIQNSRGGSHLAPTSDQRVNSEMAKEQWTKDYDQKYQDEYVRQFIQNARKNGVDIKVNKDLDVTGVMPYPVEQPIRIPQSESPPTPASGATK